MLTQDWATGTWTDSSGALPLGAAPLSGNFGFAVNMTDHVHTVISQSSGSVRIRMVWIGASFPPPPSFINLKLMSSTSFSYSVGGGSGTGSDGIGGSITLDDEGNGTYGHVFGTKLRTFPVSPAGVVDFTYSPAASSIASDFHSNCGAAACWVNCHKDYRGVSLVPTTFTGANKKSFTGSTLTTPQMLDWDGAHSYSYLGAISVPNLFDYTPTGTKFKADVALPLYEFDRALDGFYMDVNQMISNSAFQGYVWAISDGTYSYSGSAGSDSGHRGQGLLFTNYDIPSISTRLENPLTTYDGGWDPKALMIRKHDEVITPHAAGSTGTSNFNYIWDLDGFSADAQVVLNYKFPAEGNVVGEHNEVLEPAPSAPRSSTDPFPRIAAFSDLGTWVTNGSSVASGFWQAQNNSWTIASKTQAEQVKAIAGVIGLIPQAKITASAVGAYVDFYAKFEPFPTPIQYSEDVFLFEKAYYLGQIDPMPSSWPSNLQDMRALMSGYEWKEQRRQLYTIRYMSIDSYDSTGYVGQSLATHFDVDGFFDSRQQFRWRGTQGGN